MALMHDLLGSKKQVDLGEEDDPDESNFRLYGDSLLVPGQRQSTQGSIEIENEIKRKPSKPSISIGSQNSIDKGRESKFKKSDSAPMLKKASIA